jgi:hypothetical protein
LCWCSYLTVQQANAFDELSLTEVGAELGAIIEFQSTRWFAAAVPMLVHDFGGDTRNGERVDDKWDFAYAAHLAFAPSESWSLALEG